jgi:hypothetical protein
VGVEARRALGGSGAAGDGHAWFTGFLAETLKAVRQGIVVGAGLAPVLLLVELTPLGHATTAAAAVAWAGYWVVVDALEIPVALAPRRLAGPGAPTWFERRLRRLARARLPLALAVVSWPIRAFLALGARWGGALARPWRREVKLTERHAWETLGFGLAAGLFLAVPVLGLFFRAVAMTGATALVVRLEDVGPPRASR